LQRQAVLALLLLRHIAHQAAQRQRIARLLPLAQAQLKLQHMPVQRVVPQRRAFNRLAFQRPPEQ
jgi:hypothetical protein